MYFFTSENHRPVVSLPETFNLVNFSLFKKLDSAIPFRNFSIKYVGKGNETYDINGNRFPIKDGEYLLAKQHSEGRIHIDSHTDVSGICIELMPTLIADVVASYRRPDTALPDPGLDVFFSSDRYPENQYHSSQTHLGKMLRQLDGYISMNPHQDLIISNEIYYTLAENLITDHIPTYRQLQNLGRIKPATGKDLLRKVMLGKNLIEQHYREPWDIADVAKLCCMSEYHFFRIFKKAFGISPYQYLIDVRLNWAFQQIKQQQQSISFIAHETGFADLSSFSKAFSKKFGFPPSKWSGSN